MISRNCKDVGCKVMGPEANGVLKVGQMSWLETHIDVSLWAAFGPISPGTMSFKSPSLVNSNADGAFDDGRLPHASGHGRRPAPRRENKLPGTKPDISVLDEAQAKHSGHSLWRENIC